MITGFNTDVEHRGRVFHVQTEEKGPANQVVETLVYSGGEIVAHISTSYAKFAYSSEFDGEQLLQRMRHQHKTLIHALLADRLDLPHEGLIEPSFDELVSNCLANQPTSPEDTAARKRKLQGVLARLESEIERQQTAEPTSPVRTPAGPSDRKRPRRIDPSAVQVKPPRRSWRAPIWGMTSLFAIIAFGLFLEQSLRPPRSGPIPANPRMPAPSDSGSEPAPESPQNHERAEPVPSVDPSGARDGSVGAAPLTKPHSDTASDRATSTLVEIVSPPQSSQPAGPETAELPAPPVATADSAPPSTGEPIDTQVASVTPAPRPDENPPEPPELPPISDAPTPATSADTQPWAGRLIELEAADELPRALQRPFPDYTKRARKLKQEGVVRLHLLIDDDGNVAEVKLLQAIPDSDLNESAIDAARMWKYSPARRQGQPVRVWKMAVVSFRLDGGNTEVVSVQE